MGTEKLRGAGLKNILSNKYWFAGFLFLALFIMSPAATALTTISQGYYTQDKLSLGSIVSLKKDTSDQVTASTNQTSDGMLGIVINNGNSLLTLTSGKGNQIQVATSGTAQVLVSDINGSISEGDHITASPIAGVGMKATDNSKIIGIAQAGLSDGQSSEVSYTNKSGQKNSVKIGQVPVIINVSFFYKQPNKTLIPAAIQNVANAFAGKNVSTLPILISLGIFVITLIVVVSIVYSMIHSSIISVGRNPMSQTAIYRGIVQLSTLVVAIIGACLVSIYMVLTKF